MGKAKFNPNRDKLSLAFDGYVVRHLQSPILCGAPFLERNKIVQELHNRRIVIDGKYYIEETSPYCPNPVPEVSVSSLAFNLTRVAFTEPGDNLELVIDPKLPDQEYLVPQYTSPHCEHGNPSKSNQEKEESLSTIHQMNQSMWIIMFLFFNWKSCSRRTNSCPIQRRMLPLRKLISWVVVIALISSPCHHPARCGGSHYGEN